KVLRLFNWCCLSKKISPLSNNHVIQSLMSQLADVQKKEARTATTQLDQLKKLTRVVADTGDFSTLKQYEPEDATTNPSLILKAAQMPGYKALVEKAVADARKSGAKGQALVGEIMDQLLVCFGVEI